MTTTVSKEALEELEEDEQENGSEKQETEKGTLKISLKIDLKDTEAQDDTFTLYSTDNRKTYRQAKTVRDDTKKGNDTLDLEFTELDKQLDYTLEFEPGAGGQKEIMFKDKPFGKWF